MPATAQTTPPSHTVTAACRACDHAAQLDLPALIAAGHGDTPLPELRPVCSRCGGVNVGVSVSGWTPGQREMPG